MTHDLAKKMHLIASQVDGLNSNGKVKAQTGNERGYAILSSISNGCRVWAHHTLNDMLIIDLMYTKSESLKHSDIVKAAEAVFKKFAKESGRPVSCRPWQHSITKSDTRTQHYFEITNDSPQTISELVKKVQLSFHALSPPATK